MKNFFILALVLALPALRNIEGLPDDLPINKIQVIGSHNSYKKAIDPALFKAFTRKDSASASKLDYEHIPLRQQLEMGLQNLEIDVYADSKGGKYAHPKGLEWVKGQAPFDPEGLMLQPGFKVFHIPDLDFRSDGLTFKNVLATLRNWSEEFPDHYPVFITLEAKDGQAESPELTTPEQFTSQTFEELDRTLEEGLGKDRLITPDMVRGTHATLEDAIIHGNWPSLKASKGKFLFILDDTKEKRSLYIAGHPSLKGRVLFVNADPGTPEAATLIRNDPNDSTIAKLVEKGYIIRTRADADTRQARTNDYSDFIAACRSGAQIITTDYYQKSSRFKSDYIVHFDGPTPYIRKRPAQVGEPL